MKGRLRCGQGALGRLADGLAAREAARVTAGELRFAWEGPTTAGQRHYYRVQGDDLLIEYDNTSSDGNHAHTVLRRPRSDFGGDVLAAHYRRAAPRRRAKPPGGRRRSPRFARPSRPA
jgi:hypothetical protein